LCRHTREFSFHFLQGKLGEFQPTERADIETLHVVHLQRRYSRMCKASIIGGQSSCHVLSNAAVLPLDCDLRGPSVLVPSNALAA
jgi:hypothetical protein